MRSGQGDMDFDRLRSTLRNTIISDLGQGHVLLSMLESTLHNQLMIVMHRAKSP